MSPSFLERIDATGTPVSFPETAIADGEALHCTFRPAMKGQYSTYLQRMAAEGAGVIQLFDEGEVRAVAIWRQFLTAYGGRRFEIDDLVTAESHRSRGYGRVLLAALEAKARALACDTVMLASATWRVDAHRFYFRERYAVRAFLFSKELG